MFNLLPHNLRKKVRTEYKLHLLIVVFLSFLFVQLLFLVFLYPSWHASLNKEKEILSQAEEVDKSSLDSKINSVNSTIESINTRLKIINSTLEYPKVTPFFDSIISKKTKDINIKELVYTSIKNTSGKIALGGVATTRESLVSFVKNLEETKLFQDVDLPISNLTKDKNINFSISMTIAL